MIDPERVGIPGLVASPTGEAQKARKTIRKKKPRPARPQIDPSTTQSDLRRRTGVTFNIWYNKWSGGDREDKQTHAKGRCNIAYDSGYTRASEARGSFFCLHFARGVCLRGRDCEYLHRLPNIYDVFEPSVDCFGRQKFSDYRDDMGGVGSSMRQTRTIYAGRIHVTNDIEEAVGRHFAEWGEIERVRVLTGRGVAFVTYLTEQNAQFAREAMAWQSLDHNEILNVRWAAADPNPMAQKREMQQIEEQAAKAIRRALPEAFMAELEGQGPVPKLQRTLQSNYSSEECGMVDDINVRKAQAVDPAARNFGYSSLEEAQKDVTGHTAGTQPANPTVWQDVSRLKQVSDTGDGGILSSSTLMALNSHRTKLIKESLQHSMSLVDYNSD